MERLRRIEDRLVPLVLGTAARGLVAPSVGRALSGAVAPLLALLMLCVSLSFDLAALRRVLARPGVQALATVLVYGPMSLAGYLLGGAAFGAAPLGVGFALGEQEGVQHRRGGRLSSGLPAEVALPAVVYAVVQISPRRWSPGALPGADDRHGWRAQARNSG